MVAIKMSKDDQDTNETSKENSVEQSEESTKAAGIAFVHILIPVFVIFFSFVTSYFDDYVENSIQIAAPIYRKTVHDFPYHVTFVLHKTTGQDIDVYVVIEFLNGIISMLGIFNIFASCMAGVAILNGKPNYLRSLMVLVLTYGTILMIIWGFHFFSMIFDGPPGWCDYIISPIIITEAIIEFWALYILVTYRNTLANNKEDIKPIPLITIHGISKAI